MPSPRILCGDDCHLMSFGEPLGNLMNPFRTAAPVKRIVYVIKVGKYYIHPYQKRPSKKSGGLKKNFPCKERIWLPIRMANSKLMTLGARKGIVPVALKSEIAPIFV